MCGIGGVLNLKTGEPIALDLVLRMLTEIQHRGPDGFGVFRDSSIGMGNARLSIIDIAGGDQPIGNEDGTLWIVFNGEIFNYIELRPDLERSGHQFSTHSDTEVILHLYEEYGPDCLNYLNGQFAFAIWDQRRRNLFLARDRVGIRPLFYTIAGGQFIFSSEIKSLFCNPAVTAEIDLKALAEVFTYWSPLPPRTIFQDINQLLPAHYMIVQDGQINIQKYWNLEILPEQPERCDAEYSEEFEDLLIDATCIRLRADVPVGAYLSGGLDSSTTSALIHTKTSNRLDTFSISFSDPGFDESSFQSMMAKELGTDHHEVFCQYSDIAQVFPEVIWHTETPILRTAPAPMFLLSKLVHDQNFKVVMTGEGADEFLAGYDIFKEMKVRRFWARNPESSFRPRLLFDLYPDINRLSASGAFLTGFFKRGLLETDSPFYSHSIRWSNTARTKRFFSESNKSLSNLSNNSDSLPLPTGFNSWPSLSQAQYLEIVTFLSPYLLSSQGDRMSMAHSVEGRYPFLDYRVMEFCNSLPSHLKMPVLTEKYILKQLGKKYLPPPIWQRAKRPYRAPIHRSFFDPKPPEYLREILSESALTQSGLFEPHAVNGLVAKASTGSNLSEVEDMALVGILSTQLVNEMFIKKSRQSKNVSKFLPPLKLVDHIVPV